MDGSQGVVVAGGVADVEAVMPVSTPGGSYRAFGDTYSMADLPALVAAAPEGLSLTGTPALGLDPAAGTGTGVHALRLVDQTDHRRRVGWRSDTYRRTPDGWRRHTRSMTFLRRSGARDAGRPHDPTRPTPTS